MNNECPCGINRDVCDYHKQDIKITYPDPLWHAIFKSLVKQKPYMLNAPGISDDDLKKCLRGFNFM
jgi:hypothetical protein